MKAKLMKRAIQGWGRGGGGGLHGDGPRMDSLKKFSHFYSPLALQWVDPLFDMGEVRNRIEGPDRGGLGAKKNDPLQN